MRMIRGFRGFHACTLAAVLVVSCTQELVDDAAQRPSAKCGNALLDPGEVCDDGNTRSGDGCSADCRSTEVCGNGVVDVALGEVCDDGNTRDGDGCSHDCRSTEACGNGIVDVTAGEQCDSGGIDTATCDADCTVPRCGDGRVNPAAGEQCDTAGGDTAACNGRLCTFAVCGDQYVNRVAGEACDDGNNLGGDGCSADCRSSESCGNGILDPLEECETEGVDTAICNGPLCTFPVCGDGYVNVAAGEVCDDGNATSGDGCSADCRSTEVCGNGIVDIAAGEQCDDGNTTDGDGCSATCQLSPVNGGSG